MCENNRYISNGTVLYKRRIYSHSFGGDKAKQDEARLEEFHWHMTCADRYTDDINKARTFRTKSAASCAAGRGPLRFSVLEAEQKIIIKIKDGE